MSWLSKIIISNPKSKKEQLKKKAKLLETSRSFEATFKEGRQQLNSILIEMQINEERIKVFNLMKGLTPQMKTQILKIQQNHIKLKEKQIQLLCNLLSNTLKSNQTFNEGLKELIKNSSLDPFSLSGFQDIVMRNFIEIYLKGLPQYILTSQKLREVWNKQVQEKNKNKL